MTDRDLSDRDWMEDNGKWEAEENAEWAKLDAWFEAHTEWMLSRCAVPDCANEGTEKLGDTYVCPSCFEAAFQRHYDKEREMGR